MASERDRGEADPDHTIHCEECGRAGDARVAKREGSPWQATKHPAEPVLCGECAKLTFDSRMTPTEYARANGLRPPDRGADR